MFRNERFHNCGESLDLRGGVNNCDVPLASHQWALLPSCIPPMSVTGFMHPANQRTHRQNNLSHLFRWDSMADESSIRTVANLCLVLYSHFCGEGQKGVPIQQTKGKYNATRIDFRSRHRYPNFSRSLRRIRDGIHTVILFTIWQL